MPSWLALYPILSNRLSGSLYPGSGISFNATPIAASHTIVPIAGAKIEGLQRACADGQLVAPSNL
jgi:hypothetical protein